MTKAKRAAPLTKPVTTESATGTNCQFPIVGIGASAGGLEHSVAYSAPCPRAPGMAYVLVQHLDPHHDSILAELLSEVTQMEVAEVKGDVRVAPNHVYVIPPSKGLILADGMLKLVPRGPPGAAHMPIDSFLKTLADVQGSQAIGVIFSGMGTDGTLGLRARSKPRAASPSRKSRPRRRTRTCRAAQSRPAASISSSTPKTSRVSSKRLGQHPYLATTPQALAGADTPTAGQGGDPAEEREGLARVLELLKKTGGTDFSAYKKTTLRRRIARRMAVSRVETIQDYARHLEGNAAGSIGALRRLSDLGDLVLLRDPEMFEVLKPNRSCRSC